MAEMRFRILGCGSSGGVPRLGNNWGACDPQNPKNERKRCSLLVERITHTGTTSVLIDTSPDMRAQLLEAEIGELDAVVYTHEHADHLNGIDDLRMIVINMRRLLPVYAGNRARKEITSRFSYVFETPKGSSYPPILEMRDLPKNLTIEGDGGTIEIETFDVEHGNISVAALRINDVLYTPDISKLPESVTQKVAGLEYWILDSLRYSEHPSHFNVDQALALVEKHKPTQAILTNLHIDLDYKKLTAETPENVIVAYDGLEIKINK